jgi:hypothetical protein
MSCPQYCLSHRHLQKLVDTAWYSLFLPVFYDTERKIGYNLGGVNASGQVSDNYAGLG